MALWPVSLPNSRPYCLTQCWANAADDVDGRTPAPFTAKVTCGSFTPRVATVRVPQERAENGPRRHAHSSIRIQEAGLVRVWGAQMPGPNGTWSATAVYWRQGVES